MKETLLDPASADQDKTSQSKTNYPSPINSHAPRMSQEDKMAFIANRFSEIMEILGLDITDESLAKTPYRIAKMYVQEIFSGLDENAFPSISLIPDKYHHEEKPRQILVKAQFTSFCEHHFVPMCGFAHIAYIPNKQLIGLSKIHRIVRYFSKRPQLQERLTAQIADSLSKILDTKSVAVSTTATHYCVVARGVEDIQSETKTTILRGLFDTNESIRQEFLLATK